MGRRILNDALRTIVNAEKRGKASLELKPVSTVMSSFLRIMKEKGYINNFQVYDPHRVGRITVDLQGRVKDCKALTYRQDVKAKEIGQYTERTFPTRQWGYVVITTPDGVLDHEEAIKRNVGGQFLVSFIESSIMDIGICSNHLSAFFNIVVSLHCTFSKMAIRVQTLFLL